MYQQRYKIKLYDTDRNQIAKPTGILQELQDTGDGQMATEKPSYIDVLRTGRAIMLNRLDMNIPAEIRNGDLVLSRSWPCSSNRATFLRCYAMWRCDEEDRILSETPVAEISSIWSLVSLADRRILPVSELDMSNYTHGPYREVAKGKLHISTQTEATMTQVAEKRVAYSDTDCNGHMNNTYYLNLLCDQIPELETGAYRVTTVRLHYSKEAVLGETIRVYRTPKLPPREDAQQVARYLFRTELSDGDLNIEAEIGLWPVSAA